VNKSSNKKTSFFSALFGAADKGIEAEKSRLEAFLTAFPGEYCGWSADGGVAYSAGFCAALGLAGVKNFEDIQSRLAPGDAAALEGFWRRLQTDGVSFVLTAKSTDEKKSFRMTGAQGRDMAGQSASNVLWIEDVTPQAQSESAIIKESQDNEREALRMSLALNAIPRPVWIRDESQKIIWCNETYADFLNTTREKIIEGQKEIAAQTIKKKTAARGRDETLPGPGLAKAALTSGKAQETDVHIVVKGARVLLRLTEIPLSPLPLTAGIAYNNTRIEELETEINRRQSSTRDLLGHLRTAIAIYAADERLEFYNAAFAQLWKIEEQWLNAQPRLGDIMEKLRETRRLPEQSDFRKFKRTWLDMFTGLIEPFEDMLYLPDGSALRMLVIPHSMGGLMMTFEDVTSRLQLESSYNTLIAVQKETLDNLGEAVAVYGGHGRLRLWNPSFGRLWGLHPEDLEGEPHISTIAERMKTYFAKSEWAARKEELTAIGLDRVMHEGRLTRADGSLVDFSSVPLPDGGVLVTYVDVTDSVRVENALRERNAALEAAEQLKLDFLANVSYQLRTPLNAIMGFNEILEKEYFGPLNPKQHEYTRDMKEASERLLGLINDILDLSTLEAGYMKLEAHAFDLRPALSHVHDLVTPWARKEGVEITLDVPGDIGMITADERRLQQAVVNLVRNAIGFTPAGGKICVSAKRGEQSNKKGVMISVSDTGIGISSEDKARIFEPFERAKPGNGQNKNKSPRSGAGLGLSLVKSIATLHGGEVSLESEPGKGTTVTLFFPDTPPGDQSAGALKAGMDYY
jgi:signal transduction histidine kinase